MDRLEPVALVQGYIADIGALEVCGHGVFITHAGTLLEQGRPHPASLVALAAADELEVEVGSCG